MQELAALPLTEQSLPDVRQLWWKAELLKRWDAQRRVIEPIERAEPIQVGIGLTGAVVLLASLWRHVPAATYMLIVAAVLGLALLVTLAALTLRES